MGARGVRAVGGLRGHRLHAADRPAVARQVLAQRDRALPLERSEVRLPSVRVAEGLRRSAEALRRGRPDQRRGPRHLELALRALHRVELIALIGLRQRPGEQPPQSLTRPSFPRPRACGADFPRPPACSGSTSDVRGAQRPPAIAGRRRRLARACGRGRWQAVLGHAGSGWGALWPCAARLGALGRGGPVGGLAGAVRGIAGPRCVKIRARCNTACCTKTP